jgi:hypothetical protein
MVIRLQGGGGGYKKSLQFLSLSFVLTQKKQKVKTQLSRSEIFFLLDQFTKSSENLRFSNDKRFSELVTKEKKS